MPVSFRTTKADAELIDEIAVRITELAREHNVTYPMLDASMDVSACHCNGNPLDLQRLLAADDFTFAHDLFGIRRHLDRRTGKLMDYFSPRCSKAIPYKALVMERKRAAAR